MINDTSPNGGKGQERILDKIYAAWFLSAFCGLAPVFGEDLTPATQPVVVQPVDVCATCGHALVSGADLPPTAEPTTQPAETISGSTLDDAFSTAIRTAIAERTCTMSDIKGGAFAKERFLDYSPDGVLIGFRVGLGRFFQKPVIKSIQPIYLTPRGEEFGLTIAKPSAEVKEILIARAPPGYAVGRVDIRGGGGLDAITITYMAFNGTRLDPTQTRITDRIGGPGGSVSILDGHGAPVIGIHGVIDDNGDYLGLGLISTEQFPNIVHRQRGDR